MGAVVQQRAVPIPAGALEIAAGTAQNPPLRVLDFDIAEAHIHETIATGVGEDRQTLDRDIGQAGQTVRIDRTIGEVHWAERVVVVVRRDRDIGRADAVPRLIGRLGFGVIDTEFAIQAHAIVQIMIEKGEQVEAIPIGDDGALIGPVKAQVTVLGAVIDTDAGNGQGIRRARPAAGKARRLDVKDTCGGGQRRTVLPHTRG